MTSWREVALQHDQRCPLCSRDGQWWIRDTGPQPWFRHGRPDQCIFWRFCHLAADLGLLRQGPGVGDGSLFADMTWHWRFW